MRFVDEVFYRGLERDLLEMQIIVWILDIVLFWKHPPLTSVVSVLPNSFELMLDIILSPKKTHFETLLTPIDSKESICWHQFKSDHMASRQNCFAQHF